MTTPPAATVDLDEFRLVRILGQGAMGAVYLGYDTMLERDVAIKVIRARAVDDDARTRFLTEARAIARLDHPNVIAIYRASTTRGGHPYLVQELVRGNSLDRIDLPVEPRRALEIALGITRGLAAAHRRGILHRDIKPANVMIDDAGTPKLLDFGVAKLSHAEVPARPVTGVDDTADVDATAPGAAATEIDRTEPQPEQPTIAGATVGTPRYMAPEIWLGTRATVRSDLYSLGVLLYELSAGSPPHAHTDASALRHAVTEGPPPRPISEVAPDLDPELAAIITSCLAREPAQRPDSADDIAHRLERIVAGAPPVPDGNPYPGLAPFAPEHRAVFYGRGADISAVVDRLRSDPLVVVAGDSGIGKSSLCRAGVVPAVIAGALGDGRTWSARTIALGRHPMAALGDTLPVATSTTGTLVVFDQLEELVTLAEPGVAAKAAGVIAELARGVPGIKVLIAVRGDFLTRVAALPGLGPAMTRSLHLLRVLSLSDARDAVVGPARAKGVGFETEAMIETLASSIADEPGALPLLSFALAELWQRRDVDRATIPASALDAIGGVAGALARHADAVIGALAGPERAAARRIALGLVTAEATRDDRERHELCPDDDPASATALEAMIRGRLVIARNTASGEPTYELAHDSLIAAWSTLRGWRDDAAGQRGLRTRLGAAADEWRRLGRRGEALWNAPQLAEAAGLDELADSDRAFLAASRRAVRRRRVARTAIAISLPAVVVATWFAIRHQNHVARDRAVAGHVDRGADHLRVAQADRDEADRDRTDAFRAFDSDHGDAAEVLWHRARTEVTSAHTAYAAAAGELEAAVLLDGDREDIRAQLARAIFDHALVAEADRDPTAANEIATRLVAFDDDGALVASWRKPAELTVTAPAAVAIELRRYDDHDGRLELGEPITSTTDHRLVRDVEAGSYLVELRGRDGMVVRYPVLLARAETVTLEIAIPPAASVHAGMIYIPPGRFLYGGVGDEIYRRNFLSTVPLHAVTTRGYSIGKHEVTFAEWIAYLRALPASERELRRPRMSSNPAAAVILAGGTRPDEPFALDLRELIDMPVVREGQPLVFADRATRREVRWENTPVTGISFTDARAYADWLDHTGRLPGARLCTDLEWERAARGADGRVWTTGDRLDDDDANIDATYARKPHGIGPDEVGMHPRSTSPFGVDDMVGNAYELVVDSRGRPVQRSGSWWHTSATAQSANRDLAEPTLRVAWLGIRLCTDGP